MNDLKSPACAFLGGSLAAVDASRRGAGGE